MDNMLTWALLCVDTSMISHEVLCMYIRLDNCDTRTTSTNVPNINTHMQRSKHQHQ